MEEKEKEKRWSLAVNRMIYSEYRDVKGVEGGKKRRLLGDGEKEEAQI